MNQIIDSLFAIWKTFWALIRSLWWRRVVVTTGLLVSFAGLEGIRQFREENEVRKTAQAVVAQARASTTREKAIALRDYLRQTIAFKGASHDDRPFLRATANETLTTRKGYCGEVTRAFICLAREVGVSAQRINLFGRVNHVVAVADLEEGGHILIDCQMPPTIPDLEPLDQALLRPEFSDYSTLNLRRVGLGSVVSRLKIKFHSLTYLLENPHAFNAVISLLVGTALWVGIGCRRLVRWGLKRRGGCIGPQLGHLQTGGCHRLKAPR